MSNVTQQPATSPAAPKRTRQPKTFIKVVEIWVPSATQNRLVMVDSMSGGFEGFHAKSQERSFAYGEGLPGIAWSTGRPQIITNIAYSFFRRKEEAIKAGLSSAMAIPIFSGEFLLAVIVLLCGEDENHTGAMELWGRRMPGAQTLQLMDGYYGNLKNFEWISRQLEFEQGAGLPGAVWQGMMPVIMPDLGHSKSFLRAQIASEAGISTGIGIPFRSPRGDDYALTFLSAMGTPVARQFEIWIPDLQRESLFLLARHSEIPDTDITSSVEISPGSEKKVKRGEGIMGGVWMTGRPAISHKPKEDGLLQDGSAKLLSALVFPVIENGRLKAIINMLF